MLVVMVTVPAEAAEAIAHSLVQERLAACVQAGAVQSVYRWQGEVKESREVLLLIKTAGERYTELERRIQELHPYDLPEIVALPVDRALPEYQSWLMSAVHPD
ncbi:divalent-cation tolerance protein CutA [Deinococcus lacus]|uniref:Divalent-cation tolerance protein CutA n=1 Tax=Deinococcus lacus TaxID=392561 RepID=A0ABW1YBM5_9DEIO